MKEEIKNVLELAEAIKNKSYNIVANEEKYPQLSTAFLFLAREYRELINNNINDQKTNSITLVFETNNEAENVVNQLIEQKIKHTFDQTEKRKFVVVIGN